MSGEHPRILYATGATCVYSLRTAFELALQAGCDGVELDVCPETIVRGVTPALRWAVASGLPIRAIHPPLFPLPGWLPYGRLLPQLIDLALALHVPVIVLHPPRARRRDDPLVVGLAAQLAEARRRLEGTGTEVTLENPGFFRPGDGRNLLWDLAALRRFADECGVRLTLDTTHAGASPYPLMDAHALVRGRLAHVHLSDLCIPPRWLDHVALTSYVKHHQLPGTGYLPLAEFLRALAQDGYVGDIALELSPVRLEIWDLRRTRRLLAEATAFARRLLAGAVQPPGP